MALVLVAFWWWNDEFCKPPCNNKYGAR